MAYLASTTINGSLNISTGNNTNVRYNTSVTYSTYSTVLPGVGVANYSGHGYYVNIYTNGIQAMNSTAASPIYLNTAVSSSVSFWSNTYVNATGFYQLGSLARTTSDAKGMVNVEPNQSSAYLIGLSSSINATTGLEYPYRLLAFPIDNNGTLYNNATNIQVPYPCHARVGTINYGLRYSYTYNSLISKCGNSTSLSVMNVYSSYTNNTTRYLYIDSWQLPSNYTDYYPAQSYIASANTTRAFRFSVPTLLTVFGRIYAYNYCGPYNNSNYYGGMIAIVSASTAASAVYGFTTSTIYSSYTVAKATAGFTSTTGSGQHLSSRTLCVQFLCSANTSYWVVGRNTYSCQYVIQPLIIELYPSIL